MKILENVPVSTLTTMRIGGPARYVAEVTTREEVPEAFDFAARAGLPVWMMGGGANTIGRDEGFPGVIVLNRIRGSRVVESAPDHATLEAMGGEVWDDFVKFACEQGLTGIEAMSGIPGTVGAAPVQNIGAYGQDAAQTLVSVEAYDTRERRFVTFTNDQMQLKYRKSIFNSGETAGRYFIVSAQFRLHFGQMAQPYYNSLQSYIDTNGVTDLSPASIRGCVLAIRADKLPDPKTTPSAGSFFKNVYITDADAAKAESRGIPVYRKVLSDGRTENKINAGWLIEDCGYKGQLVHGMRVSDKAALILINESAKSYADLAAARDEIAAAVLQKFGFVIAQEPVEIGQAETKVSTINNDQEKA